jgi:putative transposase
MGRCFPCLLDTIALNWAKLSIAQNRAEYPIAVMCRFFGVSRSGYYDFVRRLGKPEVDAELGQLIQDQQKYCRQTYGYRRMWIWLESQGVHRNPKTVLRVMKKYGLLSEIRRPKKWVQMGQQLHKYENLLNRNFQADRPNARWVTDISYIHTGQGVLYLSMIRDIYDNSIVDYKTATAQTVNLVLDTIRLAMKKERKKVAAELHLHSDQGFQYISQAYFDLTKEYGITPSMSRRGNCYDNAMAENFFSILKTECIYRKKIATLQQARRLIDDFIYFYNHDRIQLKTGVAPLGHSA